MKFDEFVERFGFGSLSRLLHMLLKLRVAAVSTIMFPGLPDYFWGRAIAMAVALF